MKFKEETFAAAEVTVPIWPALVASLSQGSV